MIMLATVGRFFVNVAQSAAHHIGEAGHALSMRIDDAYHQVIGPDSHDHGYDTKEKVAHVELASWSETGASNKQDGGHTI